MHLGSIKGVPPIDTTMNEIKIEGLGAVQETLIIPLAMRAIDAADRRPILGDRRAEELYRRVSYDREKFAPRRSPSYYGCLQRARYIDAELVRYAQQLHAEGRDFVLVNAGCGLDTREQRIAAKTFGAAHYAVDFPEVVVLRRGLLGDEEHAIGCDLLESGWVEQLAAEVGERCWVLVAIEGVFAYLTREQIQRVLQLLETHFAGRCVVVFDALSSFWAGRTKMHDTLKKMEARFTGGIDSEADIVALVPRAHFDRKVAVMDLMAEVWWPAKLMRLHKPSRYSTQIFTFRL